MKRVYLLSGGPGVGKTTIIRQAISKFSGKAGGFYTEEIRNQGIREGFRLITLDGQNAILAHIAISSQHRVGKYGVDIASLERIGVTALHEAIRKQDLIVVDEIGKMELFSLHFQAAVRAAIESGKKVLGTIMLNPHPWADKIKHQPEVAVVIVTKANRSQVQEGVLGWMGNDQQYSFNEFNRSLSEVKPEFERG